MSTSAWLLLAQGCAWHLGDPPAPAWRVGVEAPVAEPGIDDAVRSALGRVLASGTVAATRSATARVTTATWEPLPLAADGTGGTSWRAVLVVELRLSPNPTVAAQFRAERVVVARDAGAAVDARAAAFAAMASELAPAIAAHLRAEG